jgi:hypothetical protein
MAIIKNSQTFKTFIFGHMEWENLKITRFYLGTWSILKLSLEFFKIVFLELFLSLKIIKPM